MPTCLSRYLFVACGRAELVPDLQTRANMYKDLSTSVDVGANINKCKIIKHKHSYIMKRCLGTCMH